MGRGDQKTAILKRTAGMRDAACIISHWREIAQELREMGKRSTLNFQRSTFKSSSEKDDRLAANWFLPEC
jgi:hypothetical protein